MLCMEFQKGKMTIVEARSALGELISNVKMDNKEFWHLTELDESRNLEEILNEYKEPKVDFEPWELF